MTRRTHPKMVSEVCKLHVVGWLDSFVNGRPAALHFAHHLLLLPEVLRLGVSIHCIKQQCDTGEMATICRFSQRHVLAVTSLGVFAESATVVHICTRLDEERHDGGVTTRSGVGEAGVVVTLAPDGVDKMFCCLVEQATCGLQCVLHFGKLSRINGIEQLGQCNVFARRWLLVGWLALVHLATSTRMRADAAKRL